MFRKLQDRVAAAASAVFGSETDLQRLQALGFTTEQATSALQATSGNVDRAAELLLSQSQFQSQSSPNNYHHNHTPHDSNQGFAENDDDLQRALQQSLQDTHVAASPPPRPATTTTRTPAMMDAALAAERRAAASTSTIQSSKAKKLSKAAATTHKPMPTTTTVQPHVPTAAAPVIRHKNAHSLAQHHPDVKLIPKLQDKSTEEQILRTADRMKNHPAAVDTLHRAITALFQDPNNEKFRKIDTTNAAFVRSVASAPGALDFLKALRFGSEEGRFLILYQPFYDPALVYLGVTALEQTRETIEYKTAKALLVFTKEMTSLLEAPISSLEQSQRAAHLAKCPKEPTTGQGALLQVQLLATPPVEGAPGVAGPSAGTQTTTTTLPKTIRRRFDSDDTIADVLLWIGGTVGIAVLANLQNGTWCLTNVNHSQRAPIHLATQQHLTLQSVGCWPSGRLAVQPSSIVNGNAAVATAFTNESSSASATSWVLKRGDSHGLASGTSSDDE